MTATCNKADLFLARWKFFLKTLFPAKALQISVRKSIRLPSFGWDRSMDLQFGHRFGAVAAWPQSGALRAQLGLIFHSVCMLFRLIGSTCPGQPAKLRAAYSARISFKILTLYFPTFELTLNLDHWSYSNFKQHETSCIWNLEEAVPASKIHRSSLDGCHGLADRRWCQNLWARSFSLSLVDTSLGTCVGS